MAGLATPMDGPGSPNVPPAGTDVLEARAVTVSFEGLTALQDVNLVLQRGTVLGLIGPNGAGKTTLVNVLTGFQAPAAGSVLLAGRDIRGWPVHRVSRHGVARTFQAGRLFKNLSVMENVELGAISMGLPRREARARARDMLAWVNLLDKAQMPAGALPYADERRVGIARSLALLPRFVLLDEPAAGMSDIECDDVMDTISQIPVQFGTGVLLIEHNMRVVMGVCELVQVLDGGQTVAVGTPEQVQHDPAVVEAYLGPSE